MLNGRKRIQEACTAINKLKVLPFLMEAPGIETAENDALKKIISTFMDQIEMLPVSKEKLLPDSVRILYNAIADNSISFDVVQEATEETNNSIVISIVDIEFKRTINSDTNGETPEKDTSS